MEDGNATGPGAKPGGLALWVDYAQRGVLVILGGLIVGSLILTGLAATGLIPWLQIEASLAGFQLQNAGAAIQILFTLFCASLLIYLPANARILRLERSHRQFGVDLDDITRAYAAAHAADRQGAFTLSSEFEAVRERLLHLRNHPDLGHLEPEILEISAQMSFIARDLAQVYSDDSVARARAFLAQRQQEAETYAGRLGDARRICDDLKRWLGDVQAEEREIRQQIRRLDADLQEILPKIGYAVEFPDSTVVPMQKKPAPNAPRLTGH